MKLAAVATLFAVICTPLVAHAEEVGEKSESTGVAIAVGATLGSVALMAGGLESDNGGLFTVGLLASTVAPSLGHWYAGDVLTPGLAIRGASAVAVLVGFGQALSCLGAEDATCQEPDSAGFLLAGGLIGYAAGSILDLATTSDAVRDYNARLHIATVTPTMLPSSNGTYAMGVGVGGTF
ncbi:MAG TPA: hypothetical protein VGM90_09500 [Kofleriaceae bacterium]|jgi:hypothetical protein